MVGFNKMFNKIQSGMCRLSMTGGIAIKVNDEYKTYDVDSGCLINCSDFAFDVGDDWFFAVPAMKAERGDILIGPQGPVCVIEVNDNEIKAFAYKTSTIVTMVPERHVFLGNTYFYTKIVSFFGDATKSLSTDKLMKFMMMKEMMGKNNSSNGMNGMFQMMMMSQMMGGNDIFGELMGGLTEEKENK